MGKTWENARICSGNPKAHNIHWMTRKNELNELGPLKIQFSRKCRGWLRTFWMSLKCWQLVCSIGSFFSRLYVHLYMCIHVYMYTCRTHTHNYPSGLEWTATRIWISPTASIWINHRETKHGIQESYQALPVEHSQRCKIRNQPQTNEAWIWVVAS